MKITSKTLCKKDCDNCGQRIYFFSFPVMAYFRCLYLVDCEYASKLKAMEAISWLQPKGRGGKYH